MSNKKDNIYIYLWEEFNTVYVGRTVNPKSRHYQHRHIPTEKTYQFSSEHGVEHPKMIIIENDLTVEEGVEREKYWINEYRENSPYNVLNKTKGGEVGFNCGNPLYTLEELKLHRKKYYEENKEWLLALQKKYYHEHKNEIKEKRKDYFKEYNDSHKEKYKEYREINEDRIREYKKKYREKNKEKISKQLKEWRETHKDEIKANYDAHREERLLKKKLYRESHKEEIKAYRDAHKAEMKAWRENHKEELKEYYKKRYFSEKRKE